MPAVPFGPVKTSSLDDFELVRNGEGQWLLILPAWPDALADGPGNTIKACLCDNELVLENPEGRVALRSLISAHYIAALKSDRPGYLLLCVVDDDGARRMMGEAAFLA